MKTEELKEKLESVISEFNTTVQPLKEELRILEIQFRNKIEILRNEYYDSVLVDKNGKSIKKNNIVRSDDDFFYVITDRYNQIIFGKVFNNSRVIAKKIKSNMTSNNSIMKNGYKESYQIEIVSSAMFWI